jgi:hypothetical protein
MDIQEISIQGGFEVLQRDPWISRMVQLDLMDHIKMNKWNIWKVESASCLGMQTTFKGFLPDPIPQIHSKLCPGCRTGAVR